MMVMNATIRPHGKSHSLLLILALAASVLVDGAPTSTDVVETEQVTHTLLARKVVRKVVKKAFKLALGAILAIVIVVVLFIGALVGLVIWYRRRKRAREQQADSSKEQQLDYQ